MWNTVCLVPKRPFFEFVANFSDGWLAVILEPGSSIRDFANPGTRFQYSIISANPGKLFHYSAKFRILEQSSSMTPSLSEVNTGTEKLQRLMLILDNFFVYVLKFSINSHSNVKKFVHISIVENFGELRVRS